MKYSFPLPWNPFFLSGCYIFPNGESSPTLNIPKQLCPCPCFQRPTLRPLPPVLTLVQTHPSKLITRYHFINHKFFNLNVSSSLYMIFLNGHQLTQLLKKKAALFLTPIIFRYQVLSLWSISQTHLFLSTFLIHTSASHLDSLRQQFFLSQYSPRNPLSTQKPKHFFHLKTLQWFLVTIYLNFAYRVMFSLLLASILNILPLYTSHFDFFSP